MSIQQLNDARTIADTANRLGAKLPTKEGLIMNTAWSSTTQFQSYQCRQRLSFTEPGTWHL